MWQPEQRWLNRTAPRYRLGWDLETLIFWVPQAVAATATPIDAVRTRTALTARLMRAEIIRKCTASPGGGGQPRPAASVRIGHPCD